MASVTQQTELATWIDESLDYLAGEWEAIPEIAADWDNWEEYNRLDFVIEWPLREDRFHQLQQWCVDGLLSTIQLRRWQALQELIDRNRPTLERLLED